MAKIKHVQSDLSERYKYTIQYHAVVPLLKSIISNMQNRFKEISLNSSLPEKDKESGSLSKLKKRYVPLVSPNLPLYLKFLSFFIMLMTI